MSLLLLLRNWTIGSTTPATRFTVAKARQPSPAVAVAASPIATARAQDLVASAYPAGVLP